MDQITVRKGRTKIVQVVLGFDVSNDTFESQIRQEKNKASPLIAEWVCSFKTDGTDGELILTLDDAVTNPITQSVGYMDLKRTSGGEPFEVFVEPLEVIFEDSITE